MTTDKDPYDKYVIVRCSDRQCYSGFAQSLLPPVVLDRCRNLIRWNAKTWFDLAVEGPLEPDLCLFSAAVKRAYLSNAIEVLECTTKAKFALIEVPDPVHCGDDGDHDA